MLGALVTGSGACGLVYEAVWNRLLSLTLGSTALAAAAVLAGFMGGLALGAWLAGRLLDRRQGAALPLYALAELGIGGYALASPVLFQTVTAVYVRLYPHLSGHPAVPFAVTFLLATLLLFVPTALMGATLPAVVSAVAPRGEDAGVPLGLFYGLNTLGGVAGAFATGFLLIPALGVRATLTAAAGLNLTVAAAALWVWRRGAAAAEPGADGGAAPTAPLPPGSLDVPGRSAGAFLLIAAAVSGFSALACEVIWLRLLHLTFGSSVYAFSTLLTSFLAGLGLGALAFAAWTRRSAVTFAGFGVLALALGATVFLLLPVLGRLPLVFPFLYRTFYRGFGSFQFVVFAISFLCLLVPTTLMGVSFPYLAQLYVRRTGRTGSGLGTVYALNTLGSILGALLATFWLVPGPGSRSGTWVCGAVYAGLGVWAVWVHAPWPRVRRMLTAGAAVLLTAVSAAAFPWDPRALTAGFYTTNGVHSLEGKAPRDLLAATRLVFFREGLTATVTVHRSGDELSLRLNGKADASTSGDRTTQLLLGALPFLWTDRMQDVLVIGLGSGMSAGAALQGGARSVDCVELESAVGEAARWFRAFNHDCLDDPRLRLIIGDGRNYLLASPRTYDVIVSEPSNPWIAGVSNLFTLEQYRQVHRRLKPGGWVVQWFQVYSVSSEDLRSTVRTFREVFPQAHLWWVPRTGDVLLLARKDGPLRYDHAVLRRQLAAHPVLRADLESCGLRTAGDLFGCFALGEWGLEALGRGAPLNTDDRPRLEFSAPRFLYRFDARARNLEILQRAAEAIFPWLDGFEAGTVNFERTYLELAEAYLSQESYVALRELAVRMQELFPRTSAGYYYLGRCQVQDGDLDGAEDSFSHALRLKREERAAEPAPAAAGGPQGARTAFALALTYARAGDYDRARQQLERILSQGGRTAEVYYTLGLIHYFREERVLARAALQESLRLDPDQPRARLLLDDLEGTEAGLGK